MNQNMSHPPAHALAGTGFRLATLPYQKQPAFPKTTAPTLKRCLDRPNGTSDSQEPKIIEIQVLNFNNQQNKL